MRTYAEIIAEFKNIAENPRQAMEAFKAETGKGATVFGYYVDDPERFGIVEFDSDGRAISIEEKPKQPKNDQASMGIYLFKTEKLREYLIADEADPESDNDFGKNVIPLMLNNGELMMVYRFNDYWKDVGTVDSLWDANLDLLNPTIDLNLSDEKWRIYSRTVGLPPQYVSSNAKIENSLVTDGCEIYGNIDYSILFANVLVEEGAEVEYSLVMPGAVIKKGAKVRYSIIAENVTVKSGARVGSAPGDGKPREITVVGEGLTVGEKAVVGAGKIISNDIADGEVAL